MESPTEKRFAFQIRLGDSGKAHDGDRVGADPGIGDRGSRYTDRGWWYGDGGTGSRDSGSAEVGVDRQLPGRWTGEGVDVRPRLTSERVTARNKS